SLFPESSTDECRRRLARGGPAAHSRHGAVRTFGGATAADEGDEASRGYTDQSSGVQNETLAVPVGGDAPDLRRKRRDLPVAACRGSRRRRLSPTEGVVRCDPRLVVVWGTASEQDRLDHQRAEEARRGRRRVE